MTKISTRILYSKLNFLNRRRQFQHLPVQDEDDEDIDDFRTRGSEILKAITSTTESITAKQLVITRGCNEQNSSLCKQNKDSVKTGVQSASQEVTKSPQQQKEVLVEDVKQNTILSGTERQNKVKRLKYLKRTIELARRKRFENQGSFAVNMVTYRADQNTTAANINEKSHGEKISDSSQRTGTSIRGSGNDDRSRSSGSTCVTNDVTLQVIDEDIAYYNT